MPLCLIDNGFHGVLGIYEALIIPLLFTSFKGPLEVGNLISLCQIQALRFGQFKLCSPQFHVYLYQPLLCQYSGLFGHLSPLLGGLGSLAIILCSGYDNIFQSPFLVSVLSSLFQLVLYYMNQLCGPVVQ